MPRMSASIHAVFDLIFLIILYSMLLKGLRMVARALWRSEALRVVPWLRPCTYGSCRVSDQGTTLRASDLHNARATILNPFSKNQTVECWPFYSCFCVLKHIVYLEDEYRLPSWVTLVIILSDHSQMSTLVVILRDIKI